MVSATSVQYFLTGCSGILKEMDGMDTNRIEALVESLRTGDGWMLYEIDSDKYFVNPLMEAFGDDVDEILVYLNEMDVDDLDEIEGIFEDIYGKFMTEEVWEALEKLEEKIDRESTRMKEFRKRESERKAGALAE